MAPRRRHNRAAAGQQPPAPPTTAAERAEQRRSAAAGGAGAGLAPAADALPQRVCRCLPSCIRRRTQTYSQQLTNAALAGVLVSSHARSCGVAQRRPAVFLPQDGVVSGGRLARGPGELARRCRHCRRRDCSRSDAVAGRAARRGEATTCLRMRGGAARCLQRGMPRRQRERLAYFYVKTTTRPDTLIFLRQLLPPFPRRRILRVHGFVRE